MGLGFTLHRCGAHRYVTRLQVTGSAIRSVAVRGMVHRPVGSRKTAGCRAVDRVTGLTRQQGRHMVGALRLAFHRRVPNSRISGLQVASGAI